MSFSLSFMNHYELRVEASLYVVLSQRAPTECKYQVIITSNHFIAPQG